MRYVRMFLIYFEAAFQYRSTSFVWFLLSLINPLMVLLFWRGAFQSGASPLTGWSYPSIASYYLILVVANTFLVTHIENDIAQTDIQQGGLSSYLTRPFSYMVLKFCDSLPWRLLQGFFSLVTLFLFIIFFKLVLHVTQDPVLIVLAVVTAFLAQLVVFLFKMVLGLSALWLTDYGGLAELIDVLFLIFGGFIMPLALFPGLFGAISSQTPFAYMVYYPVLSILGKLNVGQSLAVVVGECGWLVVFYLAYRLMWKNGVKKFTGIGQ